MTPTRFLFAPVLFFLVPIASFLMASMPLAAQAQWTNQAVKFADQNFLYFPGPQSLPRETRGDIATVWGGGMREFRASEDVSNDELRIKMPKYFKKEFKTLLRVQPRKAPLVVIIPGVFSNSDDAVGKNSMKWFTEMGYHVLTLPNCWSKDFAKARPVYTDEYPFGEANVVLLATKYVIEKQIGEQNITSVQIMGESLGALTAAVAYARDSKSKAPMFTAGATLTWPPINLYSAMNKLDEMMASTQKIYDSKCRSNIKSIKTKWRIVRARYIKNPHDIEIECARSIVAHYAFRRELVNLAETIDDVEDLHKPVPEHLTFNSFIRGFAHRYEAALDPNDRYGSLEYWLSETETRASTKIRILTSEDDFLNYQQIWSTSTLLGPSSARLIVAHWGGHVGLANTKAYKEFIKVQFDLRD